jgi:anti-anti-sigma regulatory factor
VFRTELDHGISDPGLGPGVIIPGRRARGRVIPPRDPQPPRLGVDPPVYDDGVLRITRITRPGPSPGAGAGPGPAAGLGSIYSLAGEIDESTLGGLAGKLAEIAAGLDEVHLDLAALDYSDLAGLRVIVQLAMPGRRVVLHRVPAHLRAILGIVGWDSVPGLELASQVPPSQVPPS